MSEAERLRHPPTMHDVAQKAAVALSSVSRALSGHPDVSPAMRERVLEAAKELGYEPDLLAQSLRRGKSMSVGYAVRDISNPLFAEMAKGAESHLRAAGYTSLLANSDEDPEIEARNIELFLRRRVDGLILSLVSENHPATIHALRSIRVPLVLLDRVLLDHQTASVSAGAVVTDHYHSTFAAVSHLLSLGHRRIALVSGPKAIRPTRERLRGLLDAHQAAGVPVDDDLIAVGSFAEAFATESTLRLLDLGFPPTAFMAGGIQSSVGVLSALRARNLQVGRDVAFVACDQVPLIELFQPSLSVVTRDMSRIGREAAKMLLGMIAGEPPRIETVSTTYIARASSSPPASR